MIPTMADLNEELGKKAAVEHYRLGNIPSTVQDMETLARGLVKRGALRERKTLEQFLTDGEYPHPETLCDELLLPYALEEATPLDTQSLPTVSWDTLCARAKRASRQFGPNMAETGYARPHAELALKEFMASQDVGFPLIANSGMGKTCILIRLASECRKQGHIMLLLSAEELVGSFDEQLKLFLSCAADADLMGILSRLPDRRGRNLVVCVDAVDRHSAPQQLLSDIAGFVRQCTAKQYPAKVLISCRTPHIEKMRCKADIYDAFPKITDLDLRTVRELDDGELEEALRWYSSRLGRAIESRDLRPELRRLCRTPIFLHLAMTLLVKEKHSLDSAGGVIDLFEEYLNTLEAEEQKLLRSLGQSPAFSTQLSVQKEMVDDLDPLAKSAYESLVNKGVLQAVGRRVCVFHERFSCYLVGLALRQQCRNQEPSNPARFYRQLLDTAGDTRPLTVLDGIAYAILLEHSYGNRKVIYREFLSAWDPDTHYILCFCLEAETLQYPALVTSLLTELAQGNEIQQLAAQEVGTALIRSRRYWTDWEDIQRLFVMLSRSRSSVVRQRFIANVELIWRVDPGLGAVIMRAVLKKSHAAQLLHGLRTITDMLNPAWLWRAFDRLILRRSGRKMVEQTQLLLEALFNVIALSFSEPSAEHTKRMLERIEGALFDAFDKELLKELSRPTEFLSRLLHRSVIGLGTRVAERKLGRLFVFARDGLATAAATTHSPREATADLAGFLKLSRKGFTESTVVHTLKEHFRSSYAFESYLARLLLIVRGAKDFGEVERPLTELFYDDSMPIDEHSEIQTNVLAIMNLLTYYMSHDQPGVESYIAFLEQATTHLVQSRKQNHWRPPQCQTGWELNFPQVTALIKFRNSDFTSLKQFIAAQREDEELVVWFVRQLASIGYFYPEPVLDLLSELITQQIIPSTGTVLGICAETLAILQCLHPIPARRTIDNLVGKVSSQSGDATHLNQQISAYWASPATRARAQRTTDMLLGHRLIVSVFISQSPIVDEVADRMGHILNNRNPRQFVHNVVEAGLEVLYKYDYSMTKLLLPTN